VEGRDEGERDEEERDEEKERERETKEDNRMGQLGWFGMMMMM
jgi:hypothetical protein